MGLLEQIESPRDLRALPATDLPQLCRELRQEIIDVCGRVGGHLGASLGTVELIVSLHRVFKSPVDRLVFDVGHQTYAHKLLTGRRARMHSLRQQGGVAPFLDPLESEHDAFAAGHACTALSVGLGILEAKRQQQQPGDVVAIVGDGALTGGLTFEAINNAGASDLPVKLVINDNGMSISRNVGAVERMLVEQPRAFFESLGFTYLGPVDGHDLAALDQAFTQARRCKKPIAVHVRTQKGRGFAPAELDVATRGHAMGPYELRDGKLVRSRGGHTTWTEQFATELSAVMERDARVVAVTPAMLEGSSLTALKARFPTRVFDVGIAEQHAVTFAAGLAHAGLKPVVCIYSTFLQRALDQVIHDVALPRLPVVFAIDRAGLVGADGATHQGAYDVAQLRVIPGLTQLAPVWSDDVGSLLQHALATNAPTAIRFPRGTVPDGAAPSKADGAPRWLKTESNAALHFVVLGSLATAALEAGAGTHWSVVDVGRLPLDPALVNQLRNAGPIISVEEGTSRGGLGAALLEAGVRGPVLRLGLPEDEFVRHGEARAQRKVLGLDVDGLRAAALRLLSETK
ncbi:MAG: 1-deoxy-D-xylulose-5-phosphate synthase [Archangium sp.]